MTCSSDPIPDTIASTSALPKPRSRFDIAASRSRNCADATTAGTNSNTKANRVQIFIFVSCMPSTTTPAHLFILRTFNDLAGLFRCRACPLPMTDSAALRLLPEVVRNGRGDAKYLICQRMHHFQLTRVQHRPHRVTVSIE